jgi:hypothetical protein
MASESIRYTIMPSWLSQILYIAHDLMSSISEHLGLQSPTVIMMVGGACVLLFVVAKACGVSGR